MLSDLPQRLASRSKEQRETGAVLKSINYEVFADYAHCTKSEEKQENSELTDLPASQVTTTKQPPIAEPPGPHPTSQAAVETNASAGKKVGTASVATTLPDAGKALAPYQSSQQQRKPDEEVRVPAAREAGRSSVSTAAPIAPTGPDPSISKRRQPEMLTRAATANPPGPSAQAIGQSSPDPSTLSLAARRTLMERGDAMLNQRNIVAARLLFTRAAEAGVEIAALKLAETYDSRFISDHNLIGIKGDQHEAETWYRKAAALGETQAEQRLKALEERRNALATQ